MFLRRSFNVLVVDDEPDVLKITRLALKHLSVYGIPLKVYEFNSRAEAEAFLKDKGPVPDLAVAFIDVVMETEHAGLDLCRFIRDEMKNRVTQLVIRTGQAGKAPEKEVIERYDITSYITKVDATEEKLYTLVKSGVRQFMWSRFVQGMYNTTCNIIANGRSRKDALEAFRSYTQRATTDPGAAFPKIDAELAMFVDDEVLGFGEFEDAARARAASEELRALPAQRINEEGDELRRQGDRVLVTLGSTRGPKVSCVARVSFDPMPEFITESWAALMRALRDTIALAESR